MPLTIPNSLTLARLVASPMLVPIAFGGRHDLFWGVLLGALATDVMDGRLARAMGLESEAGARLDSLADCALYLSAPPAALVLYPSLWTDHPAAVVGVFVGYLLPILIGWLKYRRLTSYHTLAARAVCFVLPGGFLVWALSDRAWLLNAGVIVLLFSAAEEIALTLRLPSWTPNVPTLWHGMRRANALRFHPAGDEPRAVAAHPGGTRCLEEHS